MLVTCSMCGDCKQHPFPETVRTGICERCRAASTMRGDPADAVAAMVGEPMTADINAKMCRPELTRKDFPLFAGCLSYFPDALLAVARLSKIGNDKHNPGEPLHWAKGKSPDHADCIARHLLTHGEIDTDTGLSHTVSVAWRALALLQTEIEAERAASEGAKGGA